MRRALGCLTIAAALPIAAWAQTAPTGTVGIAERTRYILPGTPVSDDPRHVPVDPRIHSPATGVQVIVGGRLFDGTGAAARPATIVVTDNRISAVIEPDSRTWPKDARVFDATGMTILPGLIDLHTHLTKPESPPAADAPERIPGASSTLLRAQQRLERFALTGITTIRDVNSEGDMPFVLKAWSAADRIAAPRIFAAGSIISAVGGHGENGRPASGPDDWRNAVREQFRKGADLIKLASEFSEPEIRAAIEEAHELGLRVTVDAEGHYLDRAVAAGVDCVEHPLPRTDATIALMARRGICSVPTLVPYQIIMKRWGGYFDSTSRRFTISDDTIMAMLRKLRAAHVKLGVGTDLVGDWFRYLPYAYIAELDNFVAVGMTPSEALVAATRTNAEILGMDDKLGTVVPGKLADILIVRGEPDHRLKDLANVVRVVRNGTVIVDDGRLVTPAPAQLAWPPRDHE